MHSTFERNAIHMGPIGLRRFHVFADAASCEDDRQNAATAAREHEHHGPETQDDPNGTRSAFLAAAPRRFVGVVRFGPAPWARRWRWIIAATVVVAFCHSQVPRAGTGNCVLRKEW